MQELLYNIDILSQLMLLTSAVISFLIAALMAYKVEKNHLKYHVFRPMLAGIAAYVFFNAMTAMFIAYHWQVMIEHSEKSHIISAAIMLIGTLVLLTTLMYSAKNIFEKIRCELEDDSELLDKELNKDIHITFGKED